MGNESSSKKTNNRESNKNATELIDMNSYTEECAEEEYIEKTECCGF